MPSTSQPRPPSHRAVSLLDEAVRRIHAEFPDKEVNLERLRTSLEAEMAKGHQSLASLIKRGRRRTADFFSRKARACADPR